jgi:hypothetical protein
MSSPMPVKGVDDIAGMGPIVNPGETKKGIRHIVDADGWPDG